MAAYRTPPWLLAAVFALPGTGWCQGGDSPDPLVSDLLQVLDEETEIATKTKLNIDFVPGMVSVLHGSKLQHQGVGTVFEALALVPGVQISMSAMGQRQVIMRGTGKVFASSNIMFMLEGVPLNSTLNAQSALFELPIEQVARIEVIRGPGSSLYGEFGFAGVVNVISRRDGSHAYLRRDGLDRTTVGGGLHWKHDTKPLSIGLNVSASGANRGVETGTDRLNGAPIANAPGTTNEKQHNHHILLTGRYGGFELKAQHLRTSLGDYFGINYMLPPPEPRRVRTLTDQTVQVGYSAEIGSGLSTSARAGFQRLEFHTDRFFIFPAGFAHPMPPSVPFPDGAFGSPYHAEQKIFTSADLILDTGKGQNVLLGVELSRARQTETWVERNYDPTAPWNGPIAPQRFTGSENWLADGLKRTLVAAYGQYEYRMGETLIVTAGGRYDYYDDVGDNLSPRLAAVYRLSDSQTMKYQYSRAFRPPTFVEQFSQNNIAVVGNPDIKPERLESHELGYVFNNGRRVVRLTVFHLDVEQLIKQADDPATAPAQRYTNLDPPAYIGAEADFQAKLRNKLKLDANLTWLDTASGGDADIQPGVARLMGNLGLTFNPTDQLSLHTQYRHVGERPRETGDSRSPLSPYDVVDFIVSLENLGHRGLSVRAGIENLFGERVVYPAPSGTYADDFPRPGRTAWLQWVYEH